jgi:hypothetical protein
VYDLNRGRHSLLGRCLYPPQIAGSSH